MLLVAKRCLQNERSDVDFQELIAKYQELGYTECHIFPGEYALLVNPDSMKRVRIYESGNGWEFVIDRYIRRE